MPFPMQAWIRERYGSPDILALKEIACPMPKGREVLVRVHAASVNDWDWGQLLGASFLDRLMSGLFSPRVKVLGCDIAGRVEALGPEATRFKVGEDVHGDLCAHGFGAFAELACIPEASLAPKPAALSFAQAAALPQAGLLALQGLAAVGPRKPGQRLLLNGAGGGVGTLALQLAKAEGLHVTAADKAGKLERLRALGADRVLDGLAVDFTQEVERYDLILDVRTDRSPFAYLRALAPGGTYATVGGNLRRLLQIFLMGPLLARLTTKRLRVVALRPNQGLDRLDAHCEAGTVVPVLDATYPFQATPDALRRFGTGDHFGKVIVSRD